MRPRRLPPDDRLVRLPQRDPLLPEPLLAGVQGDRQLQYLLKPAAGKNSAADEPEAAAEPPEEEASPEQVPEAPEVQEAEAPTRDARGRIYALHVCWNFSLFVLACFLAPILYPCQTAICLFGQ